MNIKRRRRRRHAIEGHVCTRAGFGVALELIAAPGPGVWSGLDEVVLDGIVFKSGTEGLPVGRRFVYLGLLCRIDLVLCTLS